MIETRKRISKQRSIINYEDTKSNEPVYINTKADENKKLEKNINENSNRILISNKQLPHLNSNVKDASNLNETKPENDKSNTGLFGGVIGIFSNMWDKKAQVEPEIKIEIDKKDKMISSHIRPSNKKLSIPANLSKKKASLGKKQSSSNIPVVNIKDNNAEINLSHNESKDINSSHIKNNIKRSNSKLKLRGSNSNLDSKKSLPKIIEKDKIIPDVNNIMEVDGFPCQPNDFSDLVYSIDEMNKFEDHFFFNDVLELNMSKDEYIDCFLEGMCLFEDEVVNMFLILTTKQLLIYSIVTEKTVKLFKSINVKELETIFIQKRELVLICINEFNNFEKFDLKIGFDEELQIDGVNITNTTSNRNMSNIKAMMSSTAGPKTTSSNVLKSEMSLNKEEEHLKVKNKKMREYNYQMKAFYFCVSIWRICFIAVHKMINILKITNKEYLKDIIWETGYLEKIYRRILDMRCESIYTSYVRMEENKKFVLEAKMKADLTFIPNKQKNENEENKNEKITNKFDGIAFCLFQDPARSIEFTHPNIKYSKFIIKFFKSYIIMFDIVNDTFSFIELKLIESIFINENRFVILIYLFPNESLKMRAKKNEREKIVLFHHSSNDKEYHVFRPLVIQLLEYNRLLKFDYEVNLTTTNQILNKFMRDRLNYYSYQKNNFYVKDFMFKNNEIDLSKFENVKSSASNACCCKKNDINGTHVTSNETNSFIKRLKNNGAKDSKCVIL